MTMPDTNKPFKPLLGPCDTYQLAPFAYPWAWEMYKDGRKNEWTPDEIGMGKDVEDFKDPQLDESWRHLFLYMMGQLTTMDIDRGDDIAITFMRVYKPPEIRQYLKRMCFEEAGHTQSYRYCIENFGIPEDGPENIYTMAEREKPMADKMAMGDSVSDKMEQVLAKYGSDDLHKADLKDKQTLFLGTWWWHLIFEGVWFWMGLAGPIQHLSHNLKRFSNTAEQFAFIARDESVHVRFGVNLIRSWMLQYPEVMDDTMISKMTQLAHKSIDLEHAFINAAIPGGGILGYSREDHMETAKYFVNFRQHAIGMEPIFPGAKHRFPWMSEALEVKKEKNFFETRVNEYQVGGLDWENQPNTPMDQLDGHLNGEGWTK